MSHVRVRSTTPSASQRATTQGHWYFQWHAALRLRPEYRGLTLTQVRVLDALIVHADRGGVARPSVARIARFCPGASNGSICAALRELERRGFVRTDKGDRTRASKYFLWAGQGTDGGMGGGRPSKVWAATAHVTPIVNPTEVRTPSVSSPPSEKKNEGASSSRRPSSPDLRSQETEAVGAVHHTFPDFDRDYDDLIRKFTDRFGIDALRPVLADVRSRKPKTMENPAAYLVTCLRGRLEIPAAEYEAADADDTDLTERPVRESPKPRGRDTDPFVSAHDAIERRRVEDEAEARYAEQVELYGDHHDD